MVCILLIVTYVNIETILWNLYPQSIQAPNSLHCLNTRSRVVFWDSWPVTGDQPGGPGLVPWSQSQQCRPLHKVHSLLQLSPNRGRPEPACNHCLMPNCTFMTRHRLPHAYSASILSNFLNSWNTSQYHCQEEETQLTILLITVDNDQGLFFLIVLLKHFTSWFVEVINVRIRDQREGYGTQCQCVTWVSK